MTFSEFSHHVFLCTDSLHTQLELRVHRDSEYQENSSELTALPLSPMLARRPATEAHAGRRWGTGAGGALRKQPSPPPLVPSSQPHPPRTLLPLRPAPAPPPGPDPRAADWVRRPRTVLGPPRPLRRLPVGSRLSEGRSFHTGLGLPLLPQCRLPAALRVLEDRWSASGPRSITPWRRLPLSREVESTSGRESAHPELLHLSRRRLPAGPRAE